MRINRYLASSGVASRRAAESLVLAGRVAVNGVTIKELGTRVRPGIDQVRVDGRSVTPPTSHTYWVLHKPAGCITTAKDTHDRGTVMDLLPSSPRVFPVGRLDQDTSGLLLLTDDGDLTHRLLHPKYRVEKEYLVLVQGRIRVEQIARLRRGIVLEDGKTAPAQVELLEDTDTLSNIMLVITEGRKRQVRRMLEAVGHGVVELHRTRVGPLSLGGIPEGSHRDLSDSEVMALQRLVQDPS